jgi:glycine cleavage system H protein
MPDDLTFLMGKFPAVLPGDRLYTKNHMWALAINGGYRFGFTAYAVRLMKDVYFLDWHVSAGDAVAHLQEIGHIETSKAVSDLFAPAAGTVLHFNAALLDDPSGINVDNHGAGWLFELACDATTLVEAAAYHQHLADNWDRTQRLIKGKINAED